MATSRNSGHSDADRTLSYPFDGLGSLSRYDVVLALLPLGFALALLAQGALGLTVHQAVAAGAALGVLALADALFFNPPVERKKR